MGKWTLVTGGAKGLGSEICLQLAAQGHAIVVHYNTRQAAAEEVAAKCRAFGVHSDTIQGDFSTRRSTENFLGHYLSRFSQTKSLVNNVGNFLIKPPSQTSYEEFEAMFQNNLFAPFLLMHGLCDSLKNCSGAIVNLGVAGIETVHACTYCTAYSAAKLSLWMLTKSFARELAPFHVRVNMVSPGYLETSIDLPKDLSKLPMQRPGTLQEVARTVAFLLHPDSSYITGQNIEVAGGIRL